MSVSALTAAVVLTYDTTTAPGFSAFQPRSWSAVRESASEHPAAASGISTRFCGAHQTNGSSNMLLPEALTAPSQGNAQKTAQGDLFVGWGALPYFSEFDSHGKLIFNAQFPAGVNTYRAYLLPWGREGGWGAPWGPGSPGGGGGHGGDGPFRVTRVGEAIVRRRDTKLLVEHAGESRINLIRAGAAAVWTSGLAIYALDVPTELYS